ncbi:hypothetical protein GA0070216_113116 [Micromonospora matsumotoense]|uniref:WXG100 family type VII secretion target n=1 Tax=Micromonospora matsumotoense TaxID=121616 RepID=A0A1C5A502_9ACTN|nr:hypothetical protein [Micromonospora matsumotoense]SCF40114.1 hypothetical protein GA0070216_113116 [Micromonospora matsumotoense]
MSRPSGSIWVDPEGVIEAGDSYARHIARYDSYLRQLSHLRTQYGPAWGDDDIGNQFKKQFDQTIDAIEDTIRRVKGSLEYAAVGLRLSGEGYRQADEEANEAGRQISSAFEELPTQFRLRQSTAGEDPPLHEAGVEVARPLLKLGKASLEVGVTVAGRNIDPKAPQGPGEPMEAARLFAGSVIEKEPAQRPAQRIEAGVLHAEPLIDKEPAHYAQQAALAPMVPAISSFRHYGTAGVLIDGDPIPSGYQLQTLSTFSDGTSRADANYYDSIVPLGVRHRVTGPDGQPVDSGGDQFFLVKPKEGPAPDPTSSAYRPLLISFRSDGTAVPLLTDPS